MPVDLSPRSIDRIGHVPMYEQVVDLLRAAIDTGDLQPGEALPSEAEIASDLGVSRNVTREAFAELARAGLIVKRVGAVSRVTMPPPQRRMSADRYQEELALLDAAGPHPLTSAFTADLDIGWDQYHVDTTIEHVKASTKDAELLAVRRGAAIVRRTFVKYIDNEPVQLQRSAVPAAIAKGAGSPLAQTTAQPYPGGTIAELYVSGFRVTRVIEEVAARMPTADERRQLQMLQPAAVWDIERVFLVGQRRVEASRVVSPAARATLHYETDLS